MNTFMTPEGRKKKNSTEAKKEINSNNVTLGCELHLHK
jgi:hypothetical protein